MVLPSKEPEPSSIRREAGFNSITEVESVSAVTNYQLKAKWNKPDENYLENFFENILCTQTKKSWSRHSGLKEILNRKDGDFEPCYKQSEIHVQKGGQQIETSKGQVCFQVTTYELWTVLKLQAQQKDGLFRATNREHCLKTVYDHLHTI